MEDKLKIQLINNIINIVCNSYKVSRSIIWSKSRKEEILRVRQVAQSISRSLLAKKMSLDFMGMHLGGYDHCIILNSSKTIGNLVDTDKEFALKYSRLHALCESKVSRKLKIKSRIRIIHLWFWIITIERK